ncbi:hypothetical protein A7Q10_09870 [Methylacidiphilum caldifontis]|uniref:Uncharacterized protein n=1 Tax=Methylacidiphilum caldifontis TaxID=2795386 RepID=A0A4Y8P8Y4_9BACT|nr:hypothetical protein A7Q10_09870 [Methylacidiphilum caldifontis]
MKNFWIQEASRKKDPLLQHFLRQNNNCTSTVPNKSPNPWTSLIQCVLFDSSNTQFDGVSNFMKKIYDDLYDCICNYGNRDNIVTLNNINNFQQEYKKIFSALKNYSPFIQVCDDKFYAELSIHHPN